MAETQIKTALQSNIWCSVLVPFSSMSCFIGQDHDYSINIVVRERARASRVVNFFEFNQCTPSWLAGCTWHSLACIDSSPFMKKLPGNALVRTFRNTLCCWNNQQIQVSPRNQKQHFPLTACQATVTTNSLSNLLFCFYRMILHSQAGRPITWTTWHSINQVLQSSDALRGSFGSCMIMSDYTVTDYWQIIVGHFTCRTPSVVKNAYADLAKDCQV